MPDYPKQPLEFYGFSTAQPSDWNAVFETEHCPFLNRRCTKQRKSDPGQTIGSCTLGYAGQAVIVCPHRFLAGQQIFRDAASLLTRHEPGSALHVVPEVSIPGGNIDYFVVSVHNGSIVDYVGLEIQGLDTTASGGIWMARQDLEAGRPVNERYDYGLNWKMSAKTILVQLHHKAETFALLGRRLALVLQDVFLAYIQQAFSTEHLHAVELQDTVHFHVYHLDSVFALHLAQRSSTSVQGIAAMLGLKAGAGIDERALIHRLQAKLSTRTLLSP